MTAPGRDGSGLSLDVAIRLALENNPALHSDEREIQAAAARLEAAGARRWPTLRGRGGYRLSEDEVKLVPVRALGEPAVFTHQVGSADLLAQVPLFTGGRISHSIGAARALYGASEHRLARRRGELAFQVESAFYGILGEERVIASLEFSQRALREHYRRMQALLDAQKAARVDLLRTQVRLADIEQRLTSQRNTLTVQQRRLVYLLGWPEERDLSGLQGALTTVSLDLEVDPWLARARSHRPDFLAAQAALQAQEHRVAAARAEYWPVLSAQASSGVRWAPGAEAPAGSAGTSETVSTASLWLDVPLFDHGVIAARVREESATLAAARERLADLERRIALEVETAVLNATSTRQRALALEASIDQAQESLRIEREKYELGKGAVVDVLDAQSALLEAQTSYYRSLVDYNVSAAQLRLAAGEQP